MSEVRSIYGLLSHYRIFVKNFSKICKPITDLISKTDGPVVWTNPCEKALRLLIGSIVHSGLKLARFDLPFIVYSDFSCDGIGAVLV